MAETNGNQAVTRTELRSELHALEDRLIRAIAKTQAEIIVQTEEFVRKIGAELIDRTQEFVRDSQTELLRGFETFANSQNTRIRKLQADLSNVDASTDQRLGALERRMMEIEKRLPLPPFPPPQA